MDTFVWDPSLITGLAEVDDQHHELVDLFNELSQALESGQATAGAAMQRVFDRLLDYANHHFSCEEALMRSCGLSPQHVAMHCQMHQHFVEQVDRMWHTRHQLRRPAETIMGFLSHWLGLHIVGVDQSMARQMTWVAQGLSGEQAQARDEREADRSVQALLRMVGNLYHVLAEQNSDLVQSNMVLEQRVQERTQALEAANAELRMANAQLQVHSLTDGLLGIPNREHLDQRLRQEWARAARQQEPLGVLMLDVDHFKRYNDRYGHPAGDACLQAVVGAVRRCLKRQTDLLARYGGEELVVLLPNTGSRVAERMAQHMVDAVQSVGLPHADSPTSAVVTVSIGVCSGVPDRSIQVQNLLAQADAALYQAKHAGRNRVACANYDPQASSTIVPL